MKKTIVSILLLLVATANSVGQVDESPINIEIVPAFPDLEVPRPEDAPHFRPIVITHSNDDTNRIFLVSQQGVIYVMPNKQDVTSAEVFLDIEEKVVYRDNKNEEGLLGLAFHPEYKSNGQFFLYYTTADADQTSVVTRFTVSKDNPNRANADSEVELMRIEQPFWNHNGGSLEFGPDGYLYIGFGDGGKANDTLMNGQNVQTLLGSILRIDVDKQENGRKYGIPSDNPFADQKKSRQPLARPEIYAYGLRNVWRLSFDHKTNLLYAADVGQNLWEEINIIENGGNYGWNLREGKHKFGPAGSEPRADLIDPIWEYDHETGKSITGGQVYRGSKVPSLDGYYLYADYVSSRFWALKYDPASGKVQENREIPKPANRDFPIMTFGVDEQGEVYCGDAFGKMYRFQSKK
jgi:quinoprotein glucose dehydrogenase